MSENERTVERARTLEASPEEVWRALTDESLLREWLADDADFDPVPGAELSLVVAGEERRGAVLAVEEERSLAFTWGREGEAPSEVRFTLEPAVSGTRLTVVERGGSPTVAGGGPMAMAGERWTSRLHTLELVLGALVAA
jgi:uncharacterized protein YndB with AHSA1/START domain